MAWRVEFHDGAWGTDLDDLTHIERQAIQDEVASWIPAGPPDDPIKTYPSGLEVFEHDVAGCVVTYQIAEYDFDPVVEVKRIRPRYPLGGGQVF